jgi:hypothetical protein
MSLLVPNNGEGDAAAAFVNKSALSDLVLRLFTNNITPAETDTAATYTEASGSGYGALTLTGASWTVTEGAPTQATYSQQIYTFTGALGNCYGYFMTRSAGGRIAVAERFSDGPYNVVNNGDQIKVTPQITFD